MQYNQEMNNNGFMRPILEFKQVKHYHHTTENTLKKIQMRVIWKSCDLIIEVTHYHGMYICMQYLVGTTREVASTYSLQKKKSADFK